MLADGFKYRYTTIPFAFYKQPPYPGKLLLFAHNHKELEIIAMIEGAVDFYIDSACYSLKNNDLLIIPPYCIHRADIKPNTRYDCACFDLSVLWDEKLKNGLESGDITVNDHLSDKYDFTAEMNKCVRTAIASCETGTPGWEMSVIGNLSILFGQLKKIGFFVKSSALHNNQAFERKVLDYVSEHFFEPLTSSDMSEYLHLNNSYFCRLFKKIFNCSFSEYLIEYRIERAKFDITNSTLSISDIALNTGFNSFSYFSKTFKSIVGTTPSEYRKKINNDKTPAQP